MKLYFIRHGESEANEKYIHAGWAPVHLTEKGIEDARKAGKLIEGIDFNCVFSSDLVRVRETCFYATGNTGPVLRQELREMNVGSLVGKCPTNLFVELGDEYRKNYVERNFRPYGGENMDDIFSRVASFMQEMEQEPYASKERILAFASEGAIDMAFSYVLGGISDVVWKVSCWNGSISVFSFEKGKWKVERWNYTGEI